MSETAGLRVVFAGTPDFAARHLTALIDSHHQVVGVYTQPDRPAGRGKKLQASPVKELAMASGLDVQQPQTLKAAHEQQRLADYNADIMVVVAYGLLLPQSILTTPRLGCINVHASILPRWRGAAPIQRAIEAGDNTSGVTIMQMDAGLDTGAMLHVSECPIMATDNAASLHDRLALLGPPALLKTLDDLAGNQVRAQAQDDHLATYAHKLSKEEALIDWHQSAATLCRRIRAFNPFPVAYTVLDDERLRIYSAVEVPVKHEQPAGTVLENRKQLVIACANGTSLAIETLQLPGKKALPTEAVLHGLSTKVCTGKQLGRL